MTIFKDKKIKDAITYHSWQWDVAIFQQSGWDDWHLLSYIFHSLQGFLGDLARSLGENVAEVMVHLLQQVQILQLEYPRRIQPEHVEEMKHDCFYEGLNPKY